MPAANTAKKQRGKPFTKGQSGNPNGKPKGTRNRATMAAEALLEGEAEALTRVCIDKAKKGDSTALRLCMERIYPPRKDRPVTFDMPAVDDAGSVVAAIGAVLLSAGQGALSLTEAQCVVSMIEAQRRCIETHDLERRVSALEAGDAK